MLNVLIAEKDPEVIKNFTAHIRHSFPEIKNISSISNPQINISKHISGNESTIIIADIRFFGIHGATTIKEVNDSFSNVGFLLYSSLSDTDYLKKSLEYGVIDYMFKPVKQADFVRSFTKVIQFFKQYEEMVQTEKAFADDYKKNVLMFENMFLDNILYGNLTNANEINESMRYFNIDLEPPYSVFVVRIDHFKKIILALTEMEKQVYSHKVFSIVKAALADKNHKAYLASLNSIAVILGGQYDLEEIVEMCEQLKDDIHKSANTRVSIGVGNSYSDVTDIATSYKEADGALRHKFKIGYNSVIPIQYVEPLNTITYRYPFEREDRLVHSAVVGEYEYCIRVLDEIISALKKCEPLPNGLLPKIIMDILISISRYALEQNTLKNTNFTTFFPSQEVLLLKTADEAHNYLSVSLKNFCNHILQAKNETDMGLIEKTKEYVNEKYYESFSLQKVAITVGSTPDYLHKVFTDNEKISIFEYMTNIRMEKAKIMMQETKFADDVIAIKVGYDNEKHFKSMFKNIVGIGVPEYRMKHSLIKPLL
ncbi:MAG: helix-turn-helix domain-containing protein [Defluviitaleaceae bacterium]|nr:helix-turn-helix domain-containing protein [Defluviitaleaceae bacterium]